LRDQFFWSPCTVVAPEALQQVFGVDGQLRHFVDGRGSTSSWMSYVNCARCATEQNLNVVQSRDGHLYYDVIDHIPPNTELLVTTDIFPGHD